MSYLLLALLGLVGIYVALRKDTSATVGLAYAVACAMICLADWIYFGWFELYSYRPGLSANPLLDAALGEFLAEFLFVPSLTVLLLTSTTTGVSILTGTAVLTVIEYLLVRQSTFIHHGWQLWMTAVTFPGYFGVAAWYWRRLHDRTRVAAPWRHLTKICFLVVLLGPFNLALRAVQAAQLNLHLMGTAPANQSLGRFLLLAAWLTRCTGGPRCGYLQLELPPACAGGSLIQDR